MNPEGSKQVAELQVDRDPLLAGLRLLVKQVKLAKAGEAIVSFDAEKLCVRIGGVEIKAPARGDWTGEARINGAYVAALAKLSPRSNPVCLQVKDGQVKLDGLSIPCRWQAAGKATIEIPMNASIADVLRLGIRHSDVTLERSGVLGVVTKARERRDERAAKAAELLGEFGVKFDDLMSLVDEALRREGDK